MTSGISSREFKPVTLYDSHLDCLRVITADCSVTEKTVVAGIVLLERNYPEDGDLLHVGFCVEGVRHFCKENALPYHGKVRVSLILNKMREVDVRTQPVLLDIALPTLEDHNIDEVEFPSL